MLKKSKKTNIKIKKNSFYYVIVSIAIIICVVVVAIIIRMRDSSVKPPEVREVTETTELRSLTVTFIDVGQGDAILINFPDDKYMLIDGGKGNKTNEQALDKYLTVDGKKITLDYVVATHPDEDHVGSLDYVYENYDVRYSYRPYVLSGYSDAAKFPKNFNDGVNIKNNTKAYYDYLKGVNDKTPENWEFFTDKSGFSNSISFEGEEYVYTVDFAMPYIKSLDDYSEFKDPNDFSAIITVEYLGKKIMFTGDIGNQAKNGSEKAFVDTAGKGDKSEYDCDVLKVAHHGSQYSSTKEFLDIVKPEFAVISCGVGNSYKHPTKDALDNLSAALMKAGDSETSRLYRTDLQGSVVMKILSGGRINFSVETNENDEYMFTIGEEVVDWREEIEREKSKARAA
ncbi:MAG: MBL fold metallo-hydrolase [Clostridia bacterium]|nr:MBL fold metallo-hydrolase [Clostridia bacterium]